MSEHKESEARSELERLTTQQGVMPVTDLDALRGDFWPEDEAVDDFINFARGNRQIENVGERI